MRWRLEPSIADNNNEVHESWLRNCRGLWNTTLVKDNAPNLFQSYGVKGIIKSLCKIQGLFRSPSICWSFLWEFSMPFFLVKFGWRLAMSLQNNLKKSCSRVFIFLLYLYKVITLYKLGCTPFLFFLK